MEPLTVGKARELLARAVAEKGEDYVYKADERDRFGGVSECHYFEDDGTPSCIVGHVLSHLGVTLGDLGDDNSAVVQFLAERGRLDVEAQALEALRAAQMTQDDGGTWGEALAAFNEVLVLVEQPS